MGGGRPCQGWPCHGNLWHTDGGRSQWTILPAKGAAETPSGWEPPPTPPKKKFFFFQRELDERRHSFHSPFYFSLAATKRFWTLGTAVPIQPHKIQPSLTARCYLPYSAKTRTPDCTHKWKQKLLLHSLSLSSLCLLPFPSPSPTTKSPLTRSKPGSIHPGTIPANFRKLSLAEDATRPVRALRKRPWRGNPPICAERCGRRSPRSTASCSLPGTQHCSLRSAAGCARA